MWRKVTAGSLRRRRWLTPGQRAQRRQVHWIRRWNVSRPVSDAQFLALKGALAARHPVACGLRWPNKLSGSSILSDNPPGGVSDGHSIAFVGYTDDKRRQAEALPFPQQFRAELG